MKQHIIRKENHALKYNLGHQKWWISLLVCVKKILNNVRDKIYFGSNITVEIFADV